MNIVYSNIKTALATSHLMSLLSNNLPRQNYNPKLYENKEKIVPATCRWHSNALVLLSDTPVEIAKQILASRKDWGRTFGCLDVWKESVNLPCNVGIPPTSW